MTAHTYLECDACGFNDPHSTERYEFVSVMPLIPRTEDPTKSDYKTMHFCVRCFGPFAREMNRIAKGFEKHSDDRLQGKAEHDAT